MSDRDRHSQMDTERQREEEWLPGLETMQGIRIIQTVDCLLSKLHKVHF